MVKSVAVEVAHDQQVNEAETDIFTLSSGVRVRLRPVSPWFLDDARSRIPDPPVPIWHNAELDRDEPNPAHPDYLAALAEASRKRGEAMVDAIIMFGVELVDGVPDPVGWLPRLRFMEKRSALDLSGYDLNDQLDLEFVYKRYIAVSDTDWTLINQRNTAARQEAVDKAMALFRREDRRGADNGGSAQES